MAAAGFFYAGTLSIPWQLLIVVLFLFFGTLAFFTVLFDEAPTELTQPLVTSEVYNDENPTERYQNYPSTEPSATSKNVDEEILNEADEDYPSSYAWENLFSSLTWLLLFFSVYNSMWFAVLWVRRWLQ